MWSQSLPTAQSSLLPTTAHIPLRVQKSSFSLQSTSQPQKIHIPNTPSVSKCYLGKSASFPLMKATFKNKPELNLNQKQN